MGFCSHVTRCTDKCDIWYGQRTPGPLSRAKFHVYQCRKVGLQPKTGKICKHSQHLCTSMFLVCRFRWTDMKLYAFTLDRGIFPQVPETTNWIRTSWGMQKWNGPSLSHVRWDHRSHAGCIGKSVMFWFVCL